MLEKFDNLVFIFASYCFKKYTVYKQSNSGKSKTIKGKIFILRPVCKHGSDWFVSTYNHKTDQSEASNRRLVPWYALTYNLKVKSVEEPTCLYVYDL